MLEVTCFHCGQVVQISPDAERCSVCGMNLRKLIGREQASAYFYGRAADMAGAANVLGALQEVQRGLAYVSSSELNLLGAILCKRLGRWDDMRHFVAAIPADDPLRGEGEWMLRSNQARQRPVPQTQPRQAPVALPIVPDSDALPVVMDQVAPSANHRKPAAGRGSVAPLVWPLLLLLLLGGGWLAWQSGLLGALPLPGAEVAVPARSQVDAGVAAEQQSDPAAVASTPVVAPTDTPAAGAADSPAPTVSLLPDDAADGAAPALLFPTPTVATNLAGGESISEAIASTSPGLAAAASDLSKLDWKQWLQEKKRSDLADLPVTVRVQDKTLILEGIVAFAEQRAALEFEAAQVPGVEAVSVVNVKVRPPATYTVQEGDSLWGISVRIYGNADQVEELFAANRTQMSSAGDLRIGMELVVPQPEP